MPHGDSTQLENVDVMLKNGQAFKFFAPFLRSKAYKEGEGEDEQLFIETLASSDQEDLVGDVMSLEALRQMEATAVGILMFRDHNHTVEKIFGSIVEAALIEEDGKTFLWIKAHVDSGDEANVRIFNSIEKGFRLGASVTVLITKTGNPPGKKKGLYITGVKLLEISIVGIPCNQDAWTIAATASKALQRRRAALVDGDQFEDEAEKAMEIEKQAEEIETAAEEIGTTEPVDTETAVAADEGSDVTPEEAADDTPFPLAQAAQRHYAELRAEVEAGREEKSASLPATSKALFADLKDHPKFWDLIDILWACYWEHDYQVWYIQYTGETDYSEVEAEWAACLQEFAAAQIDSFHFWKIPSTDGAKSLTLEEAEKTAEFITDLAALIAKTEDSEKIAALREIGESILKAATEAGLPLPNAPTVNVEVEAKVSPELEERLMKAEQAGKDLASALLRIADLEKELGDAQENLSKSQEELEIAKAGIQANTEAMKRLARQPLGVGRSA